MGWHERTASKLAVENYTEVAVGSGGTRSALGISAPGNMRQSRRGHLILLHATMRFAI